MILFIVLSCAVGSTYKKWRRDIELALCLMDLDMCLLEQKSTVIDDDASDGTEGNLRSEKCQTGYV